MAEQNDRIEAILCSASLDDLERLVRDMIETKRKPIIDWVKNSKDLQQLFRGFSRPGHLPWDQVPTKLARYTQGNIPRMRFLLKKWQETNSLLCQKVAEKVNIETIEDNVAGLLADLGLEVKERLLWALLLDEREEIQAALAGGLREALTSESSILMLRVDKHKLAKSLEKAYQEVAGLKAQMGKLEEENQLLRHNAGQMDELQAHQQHLLSKIEQAEVEREEEIHQRDIARQEGKVLQAELVREQARNHELQQNVNDLNALKSGLEAAIANQQGIIGELKQQLDEKSVALKKTHEENDELWREISHMEEGWNIAKKERDEAQASTRTLEAQLEQLKHDKEALVTEKYELHAQLERMELDLHRLREAFVLSRFDEAWGKAVDTLSHHLMLVLSEQELPEPGSQSHERWTDWQAWQQIEASMVRPLLEFPTSITVESLTDTERAQKLLALRWYLLECLKLGILESLRESNLVVAQVKSQGQEEI